MQASIASLKSTDILITPQLGEFSTSDFDNLPSTIPIGEAAALAASSELSKLSLSPEEYEAYRQNLHSLKSQDLRPVDKVQFSKMNRVNQNYIESLMETKTGPQINQNILDADMRRIYDTGDFERVNYRIIEEQGKRILAVNAIEKNWGPNYLRFGIGLNHDFAGETQATIQARYRKTWINSLGAEWLTDFQIGSTDSIGSEFYQPIDTTQTYFIAPRIVLKRTTTQLFDGNDRVRSYDTEKYSFGIDFGRNLDEYGQIRVGVVSGVLKQSVDIGIGSSHGNHTEGAFTAGIQLDKLDSVAFPQNGYTMLSALYNSNASLGADNHYTKWSINGTYFKTFGKQTFSISGSFNGVLNGTLPNYDQNSWGGFLRLSGYGNGQMLGESLMFTRFMYYNKLSDYRVFDGLYAGFSLEAGKMHNPLMPQSSSDVITAASIFIASDSPVGPLYLGYGKASDGNNSVYLFIGYPY